MKLLRSSLAQNIGALALVQVANYVAPLLTIPYLTRVLGPEAFGSVALVQVVMVWFVIIVTYGFPWSATRDIAARRHDDGYVSRQFSANWIVQWLLTGLSAIILLGLIAFVPALRQNAWLYLAGFSIVLGNALFPIWLLQGLERLKAVAVIQVCGRLALLASVFVLVRGPGDAALAILAQGAGGIVAGLLCLWWVRSKALVRFAWPKPRDVVASALEGGKIFVSQIAVSFYTAFTPTALGLVAGPIAVGHYMLADRARTAAQSVLGPVSQALFPRLSFLFGAGDATGARRLIRLSLAATLIVSGSTSLALFVLADWIVLVLGGPEFAFAAQILRWLSPVPLCVGLSNLLGMQIMLPRRKTRAFNLILVSAALLAGAMIFPMTHWRGAEGAAMTVLVVECWVTLAMAIYVARNGLVDRTADA